MYEYSSGEWGLNVEVEVKRVNAHVKTKWDTWIGIEYSDKDFFLVLYKLWNEIHKFYSEMKNEEM